MANPPSAVAERKFGRQLDPSSEDVREITFKQDGSFLFEGEGIASFTLVPSAESALVGLQVMQGAFAPTIVGRTLRFYESVSTGLQSSSIFDSPGFQAGLVGTFITDAALQRKLQLTFVQEIVNQ